jgi:hypothetical protein
MNVIGQVSREKFLSVAEKVLEKFISLPQNPNPEKKGCYICVMKGIGPKTLLVTELGDCDIKVSEKYFGLSQEKPFRLLVRGHFSSWQSRDLDAGKYGGAITAPPCSLGLKVGRDIIIGISGLPEKGDEAVALVIALIFNWIIISDARRIADISNNNLLEPLLEECLDMLFG